MMMIHKKLTIIIVNIDLNIVFFVGQGLAPAVNIRIHKNKQS
jgi:hypothetical protein